MVQNHEGNSEILSLYRKLDSEFIYSKMEI